MNVLRNSTRKTRPSSISIEEIRSLIGEELQKREGKLAALELKQDRRIRKVERRLAHILPHQVEHLLDEMKRDTITTHRTLRLLIFKITVATEVVFVTRFDAPRDAERIGLTVIRAFDQPADWWLDREDLSLAQWAEELRNLAATYAKSEILATEHWLNAS